MLGDYKCLCEPGYTGRMWFQCIVLNEYINIFSIKLKSGHVYMELLRDTNLNVSDYTGRFSF